MILGCRRSANHLPPTSAKWGPAVYIEILRKLLKFRDGRGVRDPGGGAKINDSRSRKSKNKSEKFLKFFSVVFGPSGNPPKIIFRWSGSYISEVSHFCVLKNDPRKIMIKQLFGHSLKPRALGTAPGCKSAKFCSGKP